VVFVQVGALNRVVQETNELGYSRYFAYNDGGYLTRRIDRRGLVREFQYDTLGRNTAKIWYDTAADAEMDANRQDTLSFAYDALGRMLSADDQFASYAYDRLGRMTISDAAISGLAPTVTLTNAYDAAGRRIQVAATIGGTADFVTGYMFDQLGRTTGIRQYAFHVDADLRDAIPPASEMPGYVNILPVSDKRVDLTYDAASQPATLTRYADLSGSQLLSDGTHTYTYDEEGNRTSRTDIATGEVTEHHWDHRNRLTKVTFKDGFGVATKIVEHAYDDSQRVETYFKACPVTSAGVFPVGLPRCAPRRSSADTIHTACQVHICNVPEPPPRGSGSPRPTLPCPRFQIVRDAGIAGIAAATGQSWPCPRR
jgi:YD repeat-containing protein